MLINLLLFSSESSRMIFLNNLKLDVKRFYSIFHGFQDRHVVHSYFGHDVSTVSWKNVHLSTSQ